MAIQNLGFSVRTYNCLKRARLLTLSQIAEKTEREILHVRDLGRSSLDEIKEVLAKYQMSLKDE